MPEVLAALGARPDAFRFSLVTGNYERVARLKLARAGIGSWFPEGQGGFGSDSEQREHLPPIARSRAGDWPRERTIVIGDTPRDIACARADGLRVAGGGDGAVRGRGAGRRRRGGRLGRGACCRCSRTSRM